jgi:hypothetical protein
LAQIRYHLHSLREGMPEAVFFMGLCQKCSTLHDNNPPPSLSLGRSCLSKLIINVYGGNKGSFYTEFNARTSSLSCIGDRQEYSSANCNYNQLFAVHTLVVPWTKQACLVCEVRIGRLVTMQKDMGLDQGQYDSEVTTLHWKEKKNYRIQRQSTNLPLQAPQHHLHHHRHP